MIEVQTFSFKSRDLTNQLRSCFRIAANVIQNPPFSEAQNYWTVELFHGQVRPAPWYFMTNEDDKRSGG